MKRLIIFLTFIFLYSCSRENNNSTPQELTVKIVKSDGTPLTKSHVSVKLSNPNDNTNFTVIALGTADVNGIIDVKFAFPSNQSKLISLTFYNDDTGYMEKKLMNIASTCFENNKLELLPVTLYKNNELVNLTVNFNKQNASSSVTSFFYEGSTFSSIQDYLIFCGTISFYSDYTFNYKVAKNQAFMVNYCVYDEVTHLSTDYSIPIPIATTDIVYNINY